MSLEGTPPFLAGESLHQRLAGFTRTSVCSSDSLITASHRVYHWLRNTPQARPPLAGSGHPASFRPDGETEEHPSGPLALRVG